MNHAIQLSSLYESNVNSDLELDFKQLIESFGYKNKNDSSAFFAGIKSLGAPLCSADIQEVIANANNGMFEVEITEVK